MTQFERSIIYPVDTPPFRDGLRAFVEDENYRVKDEFHLTVASPEYRQALSEEQVEHFEELLKDSRLPVIYQDTLYAISNPKLLPDGTSYERHSIVALLRPDKIYECLGKIASELEITMPKFFPHVTIATAPENLYARRGIGIYSAVEWEDLAPKVFFDGWMKNQ